MSENNEIAVRENSNTALDQVLAEEKIFELAQRKANIYAKSSLVPKEYQNNVGNVLIAENMARRMGADPLMVMQNLYVVNGRPGWSSQFLIASFNSNGRFSAIKYDFTGKEGDPDWGCMAYCTEIATGERIEGTRVTWAMAVAEGWATKSGSKWKTMAPQMFRYRAATFLIRATAPEIGMGLMSKEEIEDMGADEYMNGHSADVANKTQQRAADLRQRLTAASNEVADAIEAVDGEIVTENGETIDTATGEVVETPIPSHIEPPDTDEGAQQALIEADEAEQIDAEESKRQALVDSAKDRIREITGGKSRETAEILHGRTLDGMNMRALKAFHKELDQIEAAA